MKLNRTRNKLMKNGYLPKVQEDRYELWIDVKEAGTPISFFIKKNGTDVNGALKVHGKEPDDVMTDTFYSSYSENVTQAINLSRI